MMPGIEGDTQSRSAPPPSATSSTAGNASPAAAPAGRMSVPPTKTSPVGHETSVVTGPDGSAAGTGVSEDGPCPGGVVVASGVDVPAGPFVAVAAGSGNGAGDGPGLDAGEAVGAIVAGRSTSPGVGAGVNDGPSGPASPQAATIRTKHDANAAKTGRRFDRAGPGCRNRTTER